MTAYLRKQLSIYSGFGLLVPKLWLAYRGFVWMSWFANAIGMVIFFYFWQAVYAGADTLGGLVFTQMITYVLLARAIPIEGGDPVWYIGYGVREGVIITEMLRPVDFQLARYMDAVGQQIMALLFALPLLLLALLMGARLPGDPLVYGVFLISLLLGNAIAFFFNWALACVTFYTTEVWGLSVLIYSAIQFLSGELIPLNIMPDWLQSICYALPFAQIKYVPIGLLSGVIPPGEALGRFAVQALWLVGLVLFSRWAFSIAVRRVTVQGG